MEQTRKMKYLVDRLSEASTWRGIVVALTGMGVAIGPELAQQVVAIGLSLAGLLGFLTKDGGKS